MEDKTPPSANATPPALHTAESLRALHERARAAMAAQRQRMSQLESQLTERLDTIASAIAEQASSHAGTLPALDAQAEIDRLQQQLVEAQSAWDAERERMAAKAASEQAQLDRRQAELDEQANQLFALRAELDSRQGTLDDRAKELNAQERELRTRQDELGQREQDVAATQQELAEVQQHVDHGHDERASRDHDWEAERAALVVARDEAQAAAEQVRSAADQQRLALEQQRDSLADSLAQARNELEAAHRQAKAAGEARELQQKFDLALEDVQRLRRRVSELEQELTARPVPEQTDSVELVHLRSERDALAERIVELEQRMTPTADADAAQEIADLQRRFELAVEDVRDLKKQNSALEGQLAEARSKGGSVAPASASGDSNWELLKQQMLASLEGDAEDGDQQRHEERSTIEGTIRITDEIVAHKDRQIAELQSRLAKSGGEKLAEDEAVRELVDADAVIQQHRAEIAKLQEEMHEKLRAAELELSLERAKIAREQVQLAELRADIAAMRPAAGMATTASAVPKRRWLSKLGLAGDEHDK